LQAGGRRFDPDQLHNATKKVAEPWRDVKAVLSCLFTRDAKTRVSFLLGNGRADNLDKDFRGVLRNTSLIHDN
jgi:hypothetical protein